jgi:hypothetical protein
MRGAERKDLGKEWRVAARISERSVPGPEAIQLLIQRLPRFEGEVRRLAVSLLNQWMSAPTPDLKGTGYRIARAVRTLAGKDDAQDLSLTSIERVPVRDAVAALQLPPQQMLKSVREPSLLEIVAELWNTPEIMPLDSEQLLALLTDAADDPEFAAGWRSRIESRRWSAAPGWRWIAGTARQVNDLEAAVLARMTAPRLVGLVLADLPVPAAVGSKIRVSDVDRFLETHYPKNELANRQLQLGTLARVFRAAADWNGSDALVLDIARRALALVRERPESNRKPAAISLVRGDGGIIERVKAVVASTPSTPVDLLRASLRRLKADPQKFIENNWESARKGGRAKGARH